VTLAESIGRSGFARFVTSPAGRLGRILIGVALIATGYLQRDRAAGIVFLVVGVLPLATGAFDLCAITALVGGPLRGAEIRKHTRSPQT
jgi:hypothetical protein